ncbi:MAG: histidine kinase [Nitrospinae bacterium]|nr:histidine kinase [Nitrospinota bacterium]MCZ6581535.1 histidine kinase [Nitrospirota bacterium]MEC4671684.1 histidine kinase [Nitrospirota bacterium]
MENKKTILIGVSDVFFYTKIRDALRPQGFSLERIRKQEEVIPKASTLQPLAVILNMNDDNLNATQALQALKGDNRLKHLPVLAFANHEEVDTWRKAKELGINKIVSRNEFSARTLALLEEVTRQAEAS